MDYNRGKIPEPGPVYLVQGRALRRDNRYAVRPLRRAITVRCVHRGQSMATSAQRRQEIQSGVWDSLLSRLYGPSEAVLARQRVRWCAALAEFERYFGPGRQAHLYTAPGRAELGGNHTDHQHGYGLAAAVNLALVGVASRNEDNYIRVKSWGFNKLDVIDLDQPNPQASESTHSASLIRGLAEGFASMGKQIGGYDAYTASDVLRGSGLSSSAAFEMAMGSMMNEEFHCELTPIQVARLGQYAENIYFGKPSGMLDQLTSALGGVIFADFEDTESPRIEKIHADGLLPEGMVLCVTDTRGSHSELTAEFAAIRREMENVAGCFGCKVLGQVSESDFWAQLPMVRAVCGDRACLRAVHFFEENARTLAEDRALRAGDFDRFLSLVRQSGHASFALCQNVYCASTPARQELSVALALSQHILEGTGGAWRMQGGGFAGTIQAFVPRECLEHYCAAMESVFGPGSCHLLTLREQGAGCVL